VKIKTAKRDFVECSINRETTVHVLTFFCLVASHGSEWTSMMGQSIPFHFKLLFSHQIVAENTSLCDRTYLDKPEMEIQISKLYSILETSPWQTFFTS
jgi:hypothetical protein